MAPQNAPAPSRGLVVSEPSLYVEPERILIMSADRNGPILPRGCFGGMSIVSILIEGIGF